MFQNTYVIYFQFIVYFILDDKELCESYEFSSNEEVPTLDKSEPLKTETKIMKYTLKKVASSTCRLIKFLFLNVKQKNL